MEYSRAKLTSLGSFATLTLGNGGSSLDGNYENDQRGKGNDGTGPH